MTSNSENQSQNSNLSRRTRSQRRRFRNVAQRIVDERRSIRQSLISNREQPSVSMSQAHKESPIKQHDGGVQPQFTLTGDAIAQLAAAVENVVRTERTRDANPNQTEQISNERYHEEEDESYIPPHIQGESGQPGSDRNKNIHREDEDESMPGRRYAWYRTPSNPGASSQLGTHIKKGWTETVYRQTDSQPVTRESAMMKRVSAMSRLRKTPSLSSLKIREGERESLQVVESTQPNIHSLKGKSSYLGLPPKIPEN